MNYPAPHPPQDLAQARQDFPGLAQSVHDKPLAFLDTAASSQVPQSVIDAMSHYLAHDHANVHRGVYTLSAKASALYDQARALTADFIQAPKEAVVFTRGATESINLVTACLASELKADDEILVSELEHHANLVPWQQLCHHTGATLKVLPILDSGDLDMTALSSLLTPNTRWLAVNHISNALGTVNPVQPLIELAHQNNTRVLIDGAQAVAHRAVNVTELDCDAYVFSSHKMYGPTGIGVLYAKPELLKRWPPFQTGGDMIRTVSMQSSTFNDIPNKFEAGTPNLLGAVGLSAAIQYLNQWAWPELQAHEQSLMSYAQDKLNAQPHIQQIGTPQQQSGAISFVHDTIHPHDLGTIADQLGVAIRTGHHCCMPLMQRLGVPATARLSFGLYSTHEDIDQLMDALTHVDEVLG